MFYQINFNLKHCRYDYVLVNGLPTWRQPMYYYRKVRKFGFAESAVVLAIIASIIHYAMLWAAYWEKCFEIVSHTLYLFLMLSLQSRSVFVGQNIHRNKSSRIILSKLKRYLLLKTSICKKALATFHLVVVSDRGIILKICSHVG